MKLINYNDKRGMGAKKATPYFFEYFCTHRLIIEYINPLQSPILRAFHG